MSKRGMTEKQDPWRVPVVVAQIPDPPEPIENGIIDLGRLATDALYLGVNPYSRKADVVFEPLVEVPDPEDHPFAALKALKVTPKKSGAKKPKGK